MSKKQEIKHATKSIKTEKNTKQTKHKTGFWKKVWNIICWPFRMIARAAKWFWNWLCGINVVGLVNLTLLLAIIILFSILIVDYTKCNAGALVIHPEPVHTTQTHKRNVVARPVKPITNTLPMARDAKTREVINEPIVVAPAKPCPELAKQIARVEKENKIMGDVVIDSRSAATTIEHGTKIQGNLYLQNMRKYTLPCGVRIKGNLFLRNVNMLQFCGEFTVTGNIYVSPRSSFGPIPATARLGGYVMI
ncbi:MAG: hypothetical protein IKV10_00750 [Alphaproteobacteria bacterium]|nr:hypothetical protein [Alphaproteobacteria bacterium]